MLTRLAQGLSIGFAAGMTPGPLQAFLALQTLRRGWRHARWIVLSPLIADGPIIVFILLVLGQASEGLLRFLSFAGGAFVLYIAWGLWKQLRAGGFQIDESGAAGESMPETGAQTLRKAIGINALSPGPWLFWSTVNGPILVAAWRESAFNAAAFLLSFYGTFLGVMVLQIILFHQARRLGQRAVNAAMWIGLVLLIGFALKLWGDALRPLG